MASVFFCKTRIKRFDPAYSVFMKTLEPQNRPRPVPASAFCSSCTEFAQITLNGYRLCLACANSMRKNDN
jgi:hypothetical protein